MKTKTKMPKAMYGKTMMKKGGIKKMQKGGTPSYARNQAAAEKLYDTDSSVRTYTNEYTGKKNPTGPMTKEEYQNAAGRAASTRAKAMGEGPTLKKKGGAVKKMQDGGTLPAKPKPFSTKSSKIGLGILSSAIAGITGKVIGDTIKARKAKKAEEEKKKKEAEVKSTEMKRGGMIKRKMKTGGMVNPNSSVSKQTVAGSKGVMSGVNPKASASKVASSRGSGRANTPPSKAVPVAKRGGMIKRRK